MSISIYTLQHPPIGWRVRIVYPIIEQTFPIKISQKGILEAMLSKGGNPHEQALDAFAKLAPPDANAILGTQISTTTSKFNDGTFLYLTPVLLEQV